MFGAASAIETPRLKEAVFYADPDFGGNHFSDEAEHEIKLDRTPWNDRITSFQVGPGVKMTLCLDDPCEPGAASEVIGPLESPQMLELDEKVSHVTLEIHTEPSIMLFKDSDCLVGVAQVFGPGSYHADALRLIGDNATTGIIVEDGVEVTLYADDEFQGTSKVITGPAKYCSDIPDFGNGVLSSFIVKSAPLVVTRGEWKQVASSNESISQILTKTATTADFNDVTDIEILSIIRSVEV